MLRIGFVCRLQCYECIIHYRQNGKSFTAFIRLCCFVLFIFFRFCVFTMIWNNFSEDWGDCSGRYGRIYRFDKILLFYCFFLSLFIIIVLNAICFTNNLSLPVSLFNKPKTEKKEIFWIRLTFFCRRLSIRHPCWTVLLPVVAVAWFFYGRFLHRLLCFFFHQENLFSYDKNQIRGEIIFKRQ